MTVRVLACVFGTKRITITVGPAENANPTHLLGV